MLFGDSEIDIINYLQNLDNSEICFPVESSEAIEILDTIHSKEKWANWRDSSGNSDPPPDFYSDEYRLMIDVMRVNDHEQKGKKGKLYNPSMARERQMFKELEDSGILKQFPNAKVYLNGDTQLPTHEDHNYDLYLKCFRRVISKHIDSIPLYKENHPGYKVIFLVFDESSAYFEAENIIDRKKPLYKGERISGRPHLFFVDDDFLSIFANKGIDYLFWYTPYKLFESMTPPFELPTLCVYDLSVKPFPYETIKYNSNRMSSVEI